MRSHERMTRAGPVSSVGKLAAQRKAVSGKRRGRAARFPTFGEDELRQFNRSVLPMRIFDRETLCYLAANDAAVKLYGYTREEFLALTLKDTRHPEEHAGILPTLAEPTGYLRHWGPRRHVKKSGEVIVVEIVSQDIVFNGRQARLGAVIDVTEGKRAEEELRRQKRLLDAIIDHLPVGVFTKDAKTLRFMIRNRVSEAVFGLPAKSCIGKTAHEVFRGEQADRFTRTDREALRTGRLVEVPEQEVVGKSGEARILHVRKVPVFDENGEPWMIVGISDDITERKRAEQALHESNEFLRSVIESSRDCIKVLDLDGRLLLMSAGGQRLLEIDDIGKVLNTSWLDFWRGPDREAARAAIVTARNGGVGAFQGYYPTVRGTPKWWDVMISPILDAEGKPAKLLAISRDVTERKEVERALHESESKYRNLVESSSDLIWSADAAGRITFINEAVRRIYGYEPGEMLGRPLVEFLGDGHARKAFGFFREMLAEGRSWADYECEVRRKDGERVVLSSNAIVLRDAEGKRIGVTGISKDITARKRAEQALREKSEFLQKMIASSRDCLKVLDLDGRLLWMSAGGQRLMEIHEVSSLLGKSYMDFWDGSERDVAFRALDAARAGDVSRFEGYCPTTRGVPKWWDEIVTPILGNDGRPEKLLVVSRDITEHKRAGIALHESKERFRQLAENIRQVFWIATLSADKVIYVSPAYEEIWGRSRDSIYRDPRDWMNAIVPEDLLAVREGLGRMARGERVDVEYRIVRPDGTLRWIRNRSYHMRGGDGTLLACGIAEDITDTKQAEAKRIADMVRQRNTLVREVHHRIKNSLQGVVGLLRQRIKDMPAVVPSLEAAIGQIQSVAVVYGLQGREVAGHVRLAEVLDAICVSAENLTAGSVVRDFGADDGEGVRIADSESVPLAVALNELVFNALKHGADETGSSKIEVALTGRSGTAEVRIANRGRLPDGFDFGRRRGLGDGLEMVRTLLGSGGSQLSFGERDGLVEVVLRVGPPLVVATDGTGRAEPGTRSAAQHR